MDRRRLNPVGLASSALGCGVLLVASARGAEPSEPESTQGAETFGRAASGSSAPALPSAPAEPLGTGEGEFEEHVELGFTSSYWVLGVAVEHFTSAAESIGSRGEELLGLTGMWRLGAFGPHAVVMTKPEVERFADSRFLGGGGLRGFIDLGLTEVSYGIGAHMEIRLADHFWLAYATPLELGAVLWARGSWNIELFLGVRRVIAGDLINSFLIDPNGFDNQDAQDDLDDAKRGTPWRGFARLVFGRRID